MHLLGSIGSHKLAKVKISYAIYKLLCAYCYRDSQFVLSY